MGNYVFVKSDDGALYTTGFFDPAGNWHPDKDFAWSDHEKASERVHYLNGGSSRIDGFTMSPKLQVNLNRILSALAFYLEKL